MHGAPQGKLEGLMATLREEELLLRQWLLPLCHLLVTAEQVQLVLPLLVAEGLRH